MEEFDFDLNNDMGTSVSQLKSKANNFIDQNENTNTHTEDFDYDKVMEHFNSEHNSGTFNYDTNRESIINAMGTTLTADRQPTEMFTNTNAQQNLPQYVNENKPRKQQNMNRFVRDLENNLDNFGKVNLNEPLPVNFTKPMIPKQALITQKPRIMEPMTNNEPEKTKPKKETPKNETVFDIINNFFNKIEFREIIICMLLFMVLNNKIIIELIYDKLPYMKTFDSPYPNLIVRTFIFGITLILIKKFNL